MTRVQSREKKISFTIIWVCGNDFFGTEITTDPKVIMMKTT